MFYTSCYRIIEFSFNQLPDNWDYMDGNKSSIPIILYNGDWSEITSCVAIYWIQFWKIYTLMQI